MHKPDKKYTRIVYFLFCINVIVLNVFYYPKWQKKETEATISWDVSGYYWYLPSFLIYGDVAEQKFHQKIMEQYHPTPDFYQAFKAENGKYVLKYAMGQAIQYLPAFAIGHAVATLTSHEADGFSPPYQVSLSIYSLLVAILGMWLLMHILLRYFEDKPTAITLFILGFASNYMNYAAIDNALTHNYLFTLYAWLILQTIRFYEQQTYKRAMGIGLLIGLMILTRPTEIVAILIPILWGLGTWSSVKERVRFFKDHVRHLALAVLCTGLVGSLQLFYWKFTAGSWIVYSYQDQGFSWLSPHIYGATLSYKAGWFVYTPIMILSIIGLPVLWLKYPKLRFAVFAVVGLASYISFAWDIWWYGGSLGQRAMIQYYVAIAFVLAALISQFRTLTLALFMPIIALCTYYNYWLTIQAHTGQLFITAQMTEAFFWKVVGRWDVPKSTFKLLDTEYNWEGKRKNVKRIFEEDAENFASSASLVSDHFVINGKHSFKVEPNASFSPEWILPADKIKGATQKNLRVNATFYTPKTEWESSSQAQFTVQFRKADNQVLKHTHIKPQRFLYDGAKEQVYLDIVLSKDWDYDKVVIYVCNYSKSKIIYLDDIWVELYDEDDAD